MRVPSGSGRAEPARRERYLLLRLATAGGGAVAALLGRAVSALLRRLLVLGLLSVEDLRARAVVVTGADRWGVLPASRPAAVAVPAVGDLAEADVRRLPDGRVAHLE